MSKTLSVHGDVNSVDTRVLLTSQGSITAPSLVTPAGAKKLVRLIAVASSDNAAAGDVVFFLRLGGNAVKNGEQVIVIGAAGGQTPQAGSDQNPSYMEPYVPYDLDIDVAGSDTISISGEMAGVDIGDSTIGVTLIFE